MFRRLILALIVVAFAATAAWAAPIKGTVASVADKTVVVTIEGPRAAWVKKGAPVRIDKKYNGKILEVSDTTVTISTPKAGELKAGDTVTFDKNTGTGGC